MRKKTFFSRLFLILSLIVLPLSTISGEDQALGPHSEAVFQFEAFVKARMARDRAPGLSIAFLKGDILWANGCGFSNLENGVPAKAESSYRLASAFLWTGRGEKAEELYKEAFARQPDYPSLSIRAFGNLAASLLSAGKTEELSLLAGIALSLRPKHAGLHAEIGDWFIETGKRDRALHFYKKAFQLNPKMEGIKKKESRCRKGNQEREISLDRWILSEFKLKGRGDLRWTKGSATDSSKKQNT